MASPVYRIQNPFYITVPAVFYDLSNKPNGEVYMRRSAKAYLNGMNVAELNHNNPGGTEWMFLGYMAEPWKQNFIAPYSTMGVEVHMVKVAIEGAVMTYGDATFPSEPENVLLIDTANGMIPIVPA